MSHHHEVDISTPNNYESQTELFINDYRTLWNDAALEAVGTALFVYISLAGVHQAVLSALSTRSSVDEIHIAICFTLGLTAGIVVALKSGAHLNSSVSFTLWIAGKLSFQKFIVYMLSQLTGGFLGALLVIILYYSRINEFTESGALIGSLGTLKNPANSLFASIVDQFIGSALLMFGILKAPDSKWKPLVIGLVLGGLGLFQGSNGFAFNLARDLAPRIASTIIYGSDPFTAADYWFWVPMIMPFFGMPLGYVVAQYL